VYEVYRGPSKVSMKAIFALPASGLMCLSVMIYPYKRTAFEIIKKLSDDWELGHSPTGWMMAEMFYGYNGHVFTPHFGKLLSSSLLSYSSMDTAPI